MLNFDNPILLLILLFVFSGQNDFDTTQLLLALALFSTQCENINRCPNNRTETTTTTTISA